MRYATVDPQELIRGLVHVVKATHDREDADVTLSFDGELLRLVGGTGRYRAEYSLPVSTHESGPMPEGTWSLPAAELRDALRRGDSRNLHEDVIVGIQSGDVDQLALYTQRSLERTLDSRVLALKREPAPVTSGVGPYRLEIRAEARQWEYLADVAGDAGRVYIDTEEGIGYAVATSGSMAAVALDEKWARGFGPVPDGLIVERSGSVPALDEYEDRIRHPDLHYMQKDLFGDDSPFLDRRRRDALERRQRRSARMARKADQGRVRGEHRPPVTLRGSFVRALAFALHAESDRAARQVRAENKRLRQEGELSSDEAQQRIRDARPPLTLSPVGDDWVAQVGGLTFTAPALEDGQRVPERVEPLREALDHKERPFPTVPVDGREVADGLDWALAGERSAVLEDPRAESYAAVSSVGGEARLTFVRPSQSDAVDDMVRTLALGDRELPRAAGSIRDLAAAIATAPPSSNARLGASHDGRIYYSRRGLQVLSAVPHASTILGMERRSTTPLALSGDAVVRAWANARDGGRDIQVQEIIHDETDRGSERPYLGPAGPLRGPMRDTPLSRELAERFGIETEGQPPLDPSEHATLVRVARDPSEDSQVREAARHRLVASLSRFVYQLAHEGTGAVAFADRLSIALEALTQTIDVAWDPDGEAGILAYLQQVYRTTLSDALPVEGGYQLSFYSHGDARIGWVMAAYDELEAEGGRPPSAVEIAERMGRCMTTDEIRALDEDELAESARKEREDATRWVELRLAAHHSGRARSLSTSSRAGGPLGERIAHRPDAPDPAPDPTVLRALGRVLDRLPPRQEAEVRSEFGMGRFHLNSNEWALYAGITAETAQTHRQSAREALAGSAPDQVRRSGR